MQESNEKLEMVIRGEYGPYIPKVVANFTGTTLSYQRDNLSLPHPVPDPNGACGPDHFVEFLNGSFSIYTKDGELIDRVSDINFWAKSGVTAKPPLVDPRIIFDPLSKRWFAAQMHMHQTMYLAITKDSDPSLGNWQGLNYDAPGSDYTMLGMDNYGVYISTHDTDDNHSLRTTKIVSIPKEDLLKHPPSLKNLKEIGPLAPDQYGYCLYPVVDFSNPKKDYTTFWGPMVPQANRRNVFHFAQLKHGDDKVEKGIVFVPEYKLSKNPRQPDGTETLIPTTDNRLINPPWQIGDNIWFAHASGAPENNSVVRFYRISDSEKKLKRSIQIGGTQQYFSQTKHYDFFNASVCALGFPGYAVLTMNRSGDKSTLSNGNVGSYLAILYDSETSWWMTELKEVQAGLAGNYHPEGASNRWGDVCTIVLDPDGETFWATNQYVIKGGTCTKSTSEKPCDEIDWGINIVGLKFPKAK